MAWPEWLPGTVITADLLSGMQWQYAEKSADQSVTSSTTLVDATDLVFPVAADATYLVRLRACHGGPTAGDIEFAWSIPSGASLQRNIITPASGISSADDGAPNVVMRRRGGTTEQLSGTVSGGFVCHFEDCRLTTIDAGNVQLQFAQATSDGTATVLRSISWIEYLRIG